MNGVLCLWGLWFIIPDLPFRCLPTLGLQRNEQPGSVSMQSIANVKRISWNATSKRKSWSKAVIIEWMVNIAFVRSRKVNFQILLVLLVNFLSVRYAFVRIQLFSNKRTARIHCDWLPIIKGNLFVGRYIARGGGNCNFPLYSIQMIQLSSLASTNHYSELFALIPGRPMAFELGACTCSISNVNSNSHR